MNYAAEGVLTLNPEVILVVGVVLGFLLGLCVSFLIWTWER